MSYPLRLNMKQVDIVIQRKRERERKRRRCINQTQDEFPLLLLHPTRGRIPKLNAFQQMKYRYMQYVGKTIKRKQQTTAKLNLQNKKKKNIFGGAFSSVCLNVSKSMGNVGLFKSFALLFVCADVRTSTTRERSEQRSVRNQKEKLSQHFGTTSFKNEKKKKERVALSLEEIKRLLFNQSSVERDVHNGSLDCWQTQ